MVKDKSRSPKRRRSRSKDRHKDRKSENPREKRREKRRSRSRSHKRRDRSRERLPDGRLKNFTRRSSTSSEESVQKVTEVAKKQIDVKSLEGKTPEEIEMLTMMGFGAFDSTKGKPVEGNDIYVANIKKKRKYRQYMNRRGGFNRPLDRVD